MMLQEDADADDLVSYWADLPCPPPIPPEPLVNGLLWMGLVNGSTELSAEWYRRLPVNITVEGDTIIFKATFEKPCQAPGIVTRIGLWSSKTRGELLYWKNIEVINLEPVGFFDLGLKIKDYPVTEPGGFRRILKIMGLYE